MSGAVAAVGASGFANAPIGRFSRGEQQRLRIAQALVGHPALLLCDEPLLSLDIKHQHDVVAALNQQRHDAGIAVVFITHEVNPILPVTDRVLYLVGQRWAIGAPDEVLTSEILSELYQTQVDVVRLRGRIIIVGAPDSIHPAVHHPHDDAVAHR